jgi:hypothetical protein
MVPTHEEESAMLLSCANEPATGLSRAEELVMVLSRAEVSATASGRAEEWTSALPGRVEESTTVSDHVKES